MDKKNSKKDSISESKNDLIAKKDHIIFQNSFKIIIKKGDTLENVPSQFIPTLKAEQVI
jgi:hypothetical protein